MPRQYEQVTGRVPACAPVPRQVSQISSRPISIVFLTHSQTSCTQGIYECSTGTGVYHTTNGGNTGGNYPTISGIMFDPAMFMYSTNGGTTWSAVPNVLEVSCFGFGAAAPGQSYPAIYIVGQVNSVYGIWQSINDAQSWTLIGTYPNDSLDSITAISGDPNVYGQVYVGFRGSGYAVLVAPS